jgi:hypothetical protein
VWPARRDVGGDGEQIGLDAGPEAPRALPDERLEALHDPVEPLQGHGQPRGAGPVFGERDHVTHTPDDRQGV